MRPTTRYAKHGDVNIAYQVVGDGLVDVLLVPGFISHLDLFWTLPEIAAMFRRLASFSRFITFDKPGTGISDPIALVATLEERMEDVHAVLDATESERAALFGISEGGPMSALFAATYPERVTALALYGTFPTWRFEEYPGVEAEQIARVDAGVADLPDHWGEGRLVDLFMPSLRDSDVLRQTAGLIERAAASPAMARALIDACWRIDVRDVLPAIRVPTVVIHRRDECFPVQAARWMAEQIPGARFVELPGDMHPPWFGDTDAVIDEVQELVTGVRRGREPDRALATVLFTDIVDSTRRAAELGDRAWRELLERHEALVRRELERFRGRHVKSTGDGMLATFDGPARAIRCAQALVAEAQDALGLEPRAGVHTGECELIGDDVGGIAVHIGARVAHLAGAGEVLVSSTVRDLVIGSGVSFADRGSTTSRACRGAGACSPSRRRAPARGRGGPIPTSRASPARGTRDRRPSPAEDGAPRSRREPRRGPGAAAGRPRPLRG